MSNPVPCQKCRMKIEFIVGPNGNVIPMQKVKSVYYRQGPEDPLVKMGPPQAPYEGKPELFVNHFETCPEASHFSRRRRG